MVWRRTTLTLVLGSLALVLVGLPGCTPQQNDNSATITPRILTATSRPTPVLASATPAVLMETPADQPTPLPETAPGVDPVADRLAHAAAEFQADTPDQLQRALAEIGEVDARYMDGPLALAILQKAGLIGPEVRLHSFWLSDPLVDSGPLSKIFPREEYEWQRYSISSGAADITIGEAQPADLLYLIPKNPKRAGKFLLVSRVDAAGRAYTTTNLLDPSSGNFQIREILLLDLVQNREGYMGGAADAYSGLLVVRKRAYSGQTQSEAALNQVLNRGGRWQVVVKPVGGEVLFNRDAGEVIHPASVIKVPLGMLVMTDLMARGGSLETALAGAPPRAGRTYAQLLRAMLVLSEETATDILEKDVRDRMGEAKIRETLDGWGAPNTMLEPRRSTALEIAALWEGLYTRRLLGEQASAILLDYLAEKTDGDSVRLWKLEGRLPEGSMIYNKRGSLTSPMIVADSGIIALPGGSAYILCVFGEPDDWAVFEELDAEIGDFAVTWYQAMAATVPAP